MKAFISCVSEDKAITEAILYYLAEILGIRQRDIFNFCVGENQIPPDSDFHEYILNSIKESDIAVFIITEESMKSLYCLFELGAAWALERESIRIFISPEKFERLEKTPFGNRQAYYVDLSSRESISTLANSLTTHLLGRNKRTPDLSSQRSQQLLINMLVDEGAKRTAVDMRPVLSNGGVFHQNSDSNTLRVIEKSEYSVKLLVDFLSSQPEFVGYAVRLNNVDWSALVKADYKLRFDVSSLPTVKKLTIEFKGENKDTIGEKTVNLSDTDMPISVRLRDINTEYELWGKMSELVFLFKPDHIQETGSILIEQLTFV